MIPILYEKTETEFTSNGLGRLRDCISCVVTEERNGEYSISFEYPVNGSNFDKIIPGRIIAAAVDDSGNIQPFDIVSCTKPLNGIVTFYGTHISYRQNKIVVSGTNINSLSDALTLLSLGEPSNPFLYSADFESAGYFAAADGTPRSVRSLLGGIEGSILDSYGGEYEFDKFEVTLHHARGIDRDFSIRYGVNLTNYNEETDSSETYSACIPYWTGQNSAGESVVVKGDLVSPGLVTVTGREEAIALDLTDKFETQPTKAEIETFASNMLQANQPNIPKTTINVDFVNLADVLEHEDVAPLYNCELCDSILVYFPFYNVEGRFKIVKTEYDVLSERYKTLELGQRSTTLSEALGISNSLSSSSGASGGGLIPGTIQMFGGATAPIGWLLCDGAAGSRTRYSRLFSVIDTTYGEGDGSSTFNLPDLRDRFPVGAGTSYNLNSKGGEASHQLAESELPTVTGSVNIRRYQYGSGTGATAYSAQGIISTSEGSTTAAGISGSGTNIGSTKVSLSFGNNEAHENRPPYIGVNFIIYAGV